MEISLEPFEAVSPRRQTSKTHSPPVLEGHAPPVQPSATTRSYLKDLQKEQENQSSMIMGMFKELMEQSKAAGKYIILYLFFKLVFWMVFTLKPFRKNEEIYILDPKPSWKCITVVRWSFGDSKWLLEQPKRHFLLYYLYTFPYQYIIKGGSDDGGVRSY